jgi:hypothetical protein
MIVWLQLLHKHGMSIVYASVGLMLNFFQYLAEQVESFWKEKSMSYKISNNWILKI